MWGKNEGLSQGGPAVAVAPMPPPARGEPSPALPHTGGTNSLGPAMIGKTLVMKAEISGTEDLYIDGEVEGSVELKEHNLTIGVNGKVDANVVARNIIVHGTLRGNVQASEKVEIHKTGSLLGDLTTAGVTIEDGAYFKGSIDIIRPGRPDGKADGKKA